MPEESRRILSEMKAAGSRADELLVVDDLTKVFPGNTHLGSPRLDVTALDGVSFDVNRGETLALVGESGSGKTTAARCILKLTHPTRGDVRYCGDSILGLDPKQLFDLRRRMQVVFQDPFASLDPRMTVARIVAEPLVVHRVGNASERRDRVEEMLGLVGIPYDDAHRKPHAFSGGQRQRIAIARALALRPEFVVLDEPVTALDMSIQAQVLNLLRDLQNRLALTYLLVVHDLAVAEFAAHRIAVMCRGKLVELGQTAQLLKFPLHPYTVALLSAVPVPDPAQAARSRRIILNVEQDSAGLPRRGCPFRPRCPVGRDRPVCQTQEPPLASYESGHSVACHFPGELSLQGTEVSAAPLPVASGALAQPYRDNESQGYQT